MANSPLENGRPPDAVEFGLNTYRDKRGRTVIVVRGELDAMTAARFGAEIGEVVRHGERDVLVDLRAVQFIDSTGMHVLLNAQRRLTRARRRLSILCEGSPVRRALELARLTETLGLEPASDELP